LAQQHKAVLRKNKSKGRRKERREKERLGVKLGAWRIIPGLASG